jgi:hypothetical protein
MQSDPVLLRFREDRARFYAGLDELRIKVDEMLDRFETETPSVADAALLEGLRLGRQRLFADYQAAADRFVEHVLRASQKP